MSEASLPAAFGRYQLLECIGRGGMAEVFKARLNAAAGTEKLVCIKRILPKLSTNSDFMSLFVREAKIALPLTHGNITQVFDFGQVGETYYLAMELVRGQNLAAVLEKHREADTVLDAPAALYIASEVCRGLHYAHTYQGSDGAAVAVVHRDVSPHNILLSYNGEAKLTDFGIALAATKAPPGEQVQRGKPCYVSPEQASGGGADPRSDVFSMGTVLFEMLTGVRLFEGETDADTLARVRTTEATKPSAISEGVGAGVDAIVLKALEKDPAKRYSTASELQVALSRELHQQSIDFTADNLASVMRDLFAWELRSENGDGRPRDRLLFQLSRAGVSVQGGQSSTDELLQMGTVALDGAPAAADAKQPRPWVWVAVGMMLLAGTIGGAVFALSERSQPSIAPDAGAATAPVSMAANTEHLRPTSLRGVADVPVVTSAEAATVPSSAGGQRREGSGDAGGAVPTNSGRAEPHPAAVVRRAGHALLNCNSWPWSVVYLDGGRLPGNTPIYQVRVPAGRHTLVFRNPELGLSKEVQVSVGRDEVKTVAVKLEPSPGPAQAPDAS